MMRAKDEDPDLLYVMKFLASENILGLPPGGGITSKWVTPGGKNLLNETRFMG